MRERSAVCVANKGACRPATQAGPKMPEGARVGGFDPGGHQSLSIWAWSYGSRFHGFGRGDKMVGGFEPPSQ